MSWKDSVEDSDRSHNEFCKALSKELQKARTAINGATTKGEKK